VFVWGGGGLFFPSPYDLLAQGLLVPAIRPPTVPVGSSRLRVALSAAHTGEQVDRLVAALGTLGRSGAGDPA
jgi:7-keto-8-aminopelargonate synthetase-like enzyme